MRNGEESLEILACQLRSGERSARTIMEVCDQNYHQTEEKLNVYKSWDGKRALAIAEHVDMLLKQGYDVGPLMGIPISIKDMFGVNGLPTYAGAKNQQAQEWATSGTLVQAITAQLAPVTGKTHTVEFAFGGVGINEHWGTPWNPWDPLAHRVPGGSSSGAGVSLCQASALLALGTDTAGSVRIPASVTGKVALKTTIGRWPSDHVVPLSSTLDTPGLLANSVADLAYGYAAIESSLGRGSFTLPKERSLAGLRVGVPEHFFWEEGDSSVVHEIQRTIKLLEQAGAKLIPITLPNCEQVYQVFQTGGVAAVELYHFIRQHAPEQQAVLGELVKLRVDGAVQLSAYEYLQRVTVLREAANAVKSTFEEVDICVSPTVAITPPLVDDLADLEQYRRANMLMLRNTSIANLMNLTAISMPVGLDSVGMPIGLQLMGAQHAEFSLLEIALGIERLLGTPKQILGEIPRFNVG